MDSGWWFLVAIVATIPLAALIGRATEELSSRTGPAMAALLSATLGNAIELIIGLRFLLGTEPGAPRIVRASIVGSLVTNLLLLMGLSVFAGGLKYKEQRFNSRAAGVSASMLIIAFAGVCLPALYGQFVDATRVPALSRAVSVVMALIYVGGVLFTGVTHRHIFDSVVKDERPPSWSAGKALGVLALSLVAIGYLAGVMEQTIGAAGARMGLSNTFVGVILIGLITNVAENVSAVSYARRDKIDLSLQIGMTSVNQIILFVIPILVFSAAAFCRPFALDFTPFELVTMLLPVLIINHLAPDGQCNWLEGVELLGLYALIATTFYFVP